VSLRSPNCLVEARNNAKNSAGKISNKFYVFGNPNLFCGCGKPEDQKQTDGESSSHQITVTKASCNHPTSWIGLSSIHFFFSQVCLHMLIDLRFVFNSFNLYTHLHSSLCANFGLKLLISFHADLILHQYYDLQFKIRSHV